MNVKLLMDESTKELSIYLKGIEEFLNNFSEMKHIKKPINIFPDAYIKRWGFPSGITIISEEDGLVFPAAAPDLGCGFRIIKTNLDIHTFNDDLAKEILIQLEDMAGVDSKIRMKKVANLDKERIFSQGVLYLLEMGIGSQEDLEKIQGISTNKSKKLHISEKDKDLLIENFGICAGHFLEVRYVTDIFNKTVGSKLNLSVGQIIIIIHSSSYVGKEIILENYYRPAIEFMLSKKLVSNEQLNRGIFGLPIKSELGKAYIEASNALVEYSYASRHFAQYLVNEVLNNVFGDKVEFELISDICHSKIEYLDNGDVLHGRGVQKIYPIGHANTLPYYSDTGDVALLAGQKGTESHLIIPTSQIKETSYLCSHGTGEFLVEKDVHDVPVSVRKELELCSFDTQYDELDEFTLDYFNTKMCLKELEENQKIINKVCRLAPLINYWGDKE
ncbi:RtcB family protein [Bacillus cereus]|uniref:tRNA-splicing ligase RtcB n=1 Tax=Bacillus cereus TaxID=1396 RepID=A0A2A8ZZV1_BACCE|nr:RtcB family protein [Bacillus cereus]PFE15002.1 hypothetical protein CN307_13435 [Bacillus cereus]